MSRTQTRKNKFAKANEGKQAMSVGEYLERIEFRKNRTWSLIEGRWVVDCEGVLLLEKDFDKLFPKPFVPSFIGDKNGIDNRKSWLYK